jgi:hypothetical protein
MQQILLCIMPNKDLQTMKNWTPYEMSKDAILLVRSLRKRRPIPVDITEKLNLERKLEKVGRSLLTVWRTPSVLKFADTVRALFTSLGRKCCIYSSVGILNSHDSSLRE